MNKKIIFVILLFIGISFIVYSFASPLNQEDNNSLSKNEINEQDKNNNKNNSLNSNDVIDDKNDDDSDKESLDEEDHNNEDNTDIVTGTAGSNFRYNVITNRVTSGNNGNSNNSSISVKPGNSGNSNTSSGNNSASGSNTPGTPSIPDVPDPIKPSEPEQPGENPSTPTLEEPNYNDSIKIINPGKEPSDGSKNEITITQTISDNTVNIILSGRMAEQDPIPSQRIYNGKYVSLNILAPKSDYTDEQLNNLTVDLIGFSKDTVRYTQKEHGILENNTIDGRKYFNFVMQFTEGKNYSMIINWGDGKVVTYNITCNIEVI